MASKYYVFPLDKAFTIIDKGPCVSIQEARRIVKEDVKRARRYFGTAVAHWDKCDNGYHVKITARKDERSALWGYWRVQEI